MIGWFLLIAYCIGVVAGIIIGAKWLEKQGEEW